MPVDLPRKAFGYSNLLLLVVILITLVLGWRRLRIRNLYVDYDLDRIGNRPEIRRTAVLQTAHHKDRRESERTESPAQLEAAFPAWDKNTPAYQILGVSSTADAQAVETAYRKLLKRYHPDRFAHWGSGYQNRAHHFVLLIQEARDRLLRKR